MAGKQRIRLHAERKEARSRITNGKSLLPYQDGRSLFARLMRDTLSSLIVHCGGPEMMSETKRMAARRVAALEAELVMQEDRIASIHSKGKEPPAALLQLYGMLADRQRRLSDALGWERAKKNVTDITLQDYISRKARASSEVMGHD